MSDPVVYLLTNWEVENASSILAQVIEYSTNRIKNDLITISFSPCLPADISAVTFSSYLIDVYRTFGGAMANRTTVLSCEDELLALQLSLADINMQAIGDFDAQISDVLTAMDQVQQRKLGTTSLDTTLSQTEVSTLPFESEVFEKYQKFLKDCNYVDFYDLFNFYCHHCKADDSELKHLNRKSFVIFDLPVSTVEKAMLQYLCSTREIFQVQSETSLDNFKEVILKYISISSPKELFEQSLSVRTPRAKPCKLSATQLFLQQVMLSYLELLVNSRSQISLARVLNVPERELDHRAFTELKKSAKNSGLPMYQQAVSFVIKLRLGGKGYAPDPNNPLMMHIKGLSLFVDLLHKLQTIIEEEPSVGAACSRVINIVKNTILKSKESLSRKPAVNDMADKIQADIKNVLEEFEQQTSASPSKPANQGGSLCGRKSLRVLQCVLDRAVVTSVGACSINALSEVLCTQGTPIQFPSLLSQFRSPDVELSPEDDTPLAQRISQHIISKKTLIIQNKSHLDWVALTTKEHLPIIDVEYVLPSKTLMYTASEKKAALAKSVSLYVEDNKENHPSPIQDKKESIEGLSSPVTHLFKSGITKRKKSMKEVNQPKAKQKCRRKLLAQVKGQTSLSAFFRQ